MTRDEWLEINGDGFKPGWYKKYHQSDRGHYFIKKEKNAVTTLDCYFALCGFKCDDLQSGLIKGERRCRNCENKLILLTAEKNPLEEL